MRNIAQADIGLSMLRLSDELETQTTLALAGRERLVALAERGLQALGYGEWRCLLLFGVTGSRRNTAEARRRVISVARRHGGLPTGTMIGKMWRKSRFHTPYLRNTLWDLGYALDTVETGVPWADVPATVDAVRNALRQGLESQDERVFTFAHLSHFYRYGASTYITYLFRRGSEPDETQSRWEILKARASEAIIANGGTISHQHGVGLDHAAYLPTEKGSLGMDMLSSILHTADAEGILNPGKLLPE